MLTNYVLDLENATELNIVLRNHEKKESEYNRKYLKRIAYEYQGNNQNEFYQFMKSHYYWQFML